MQKGADGPELIRFQTFVHTGRSGLVLCPVLTVQDREIGSEFTDQVLDFCPVLTDQFSNVFFCLLADQVLDLHLVLTDQNLDV